MKERTRYRSIFSKLVAMFLVIMIPIYGLAFFMFNSGMRMIEAGIASSVQIQLDGYLSGLEQEIERIKILQYDMLNDDALINLAIRWKAMTRYQQVEAMLRLRHRLQSIRNSSAYIEDVQAWIIPFQRIVSAKNGVDPLAEDRLATFTIPRNLQGAQILSQPDGMFLSTLHQASMQQRVPLFFILVLLKPAAFQTAIQRFNIYPGSDTVLTISQTGDILASGQNQGQWSSDKFTFPPAEASEREGYFLSQVTSPYLGWQLSQVIPTSSIHAPLLAIYPWLVIFSLTAFFLAGVYAWYTWQVMHKPMRKLIRAFQAVKNGDFERQIPVDRRNEFAYLYEGFNSMSNKLQTLISQVVHQRMLMQQAELKQLQTQINPHFLYNSFFILHTMIRTGDEQVLPFTRLLGEYFRYITRSGTDDVPLREEVSHAQAYAEIQQIRFSQRLTVEFAKEPADWADELVPRLVLQPIIENAFTHGIAHMTSGGFIRVSFHPTGDVLTILVEDNGPMSAEKAMQIRDGIHRPAGGEVTGLANIHRRIQLIYGEEYGLYIGLGDLGGLRTALRIPRRKEHHVSPSDRG